MTARRLDTLPADLRPHYVAGWWVNYRGSEGHGWNLANVRDDWRVCVDDTAAWWIEINGERGPCGRARTPRRARIAARAAYVLARVLHDLLGWWPSGDEEENDP